MIKPLSGKKLVLCGKGGCGKSTITVLLARVLNSKGYKVHVIDGDASNPGLFRMLGFDRDPVPLINFYGGKAFAGGKVTCPVDDPTPLSRGEINLEEIPGRYYVEREGITFFKVGKIEKAFGGCDGPESKINRDFIVPGDHVTLVDLGAGLEHFGRGVEINADGVVVVADPTSASLDLAWVANEMIGAMRVGVEPDTAHLENPSDVEMARKLAKGAKVKHIWVVLNKIRSERVESAMREKLKERGIEPIGSIRDDTDILESSLEGGKLRETGVKNEVERIVNQMEKDFIQLR